MLLGNFENAYQDFQKGYYYKQLMHESGKIDISTLVGMTVACAMVKDNQSVDRLLLEMTQFLDKKQGYCDMQIVPCKKRKKESKDQKSEESQESGTAEKNDSDFRIDGPEKEPYPGWCHETVRNTANSMHVLIALVPRREVRMVLAQVVECLKEEGLRCCNLGGLWKGCVGPIARKFHTWNQKWKMFGIPPDPAWD